MFSQLSRFTLALVAIVAVVAVPLAYAQAPALIVVVGDKTLALAPAELKALPRARAEVKSEQGPMNVYEGVLVGELLSRGGAPVGPGMRGTDITAYVVATASDGYTVVFSLTELNPHFTDSNIMVADTVDGQPLPAGQGPLRLIVPKEKYGTRWARMVQRLEVVSIKK